jgi:hypothetical protein
MHGLHPYFRTYPSDEGEFLRRLSLLYQSIVVVKSKEENWVARAWLQVGDRKSDTNATFELVTSNNASLSDPGFIPLHSNHISKLDKDFTSSS